MELFSIRYFIIYHFNTFSNKYFQIVKIQNINKSKYNKQNSVNITRFVCLTRFWEGLGLPYLELLNLLSIWIHVGLLLINSFFSDFLKYLILIKKCLLKCVFWTTNIPNKMIYLKWFVIFITIFGNRLEVYRLPFHPCFFTRMYIMVRFSFPCYLQSHPKII